MTPDNPEVTAAITPEECTIHKFTVPSACMNRAIQAAVLLPPQYQSQPETRFPALYAMHGMDAPFATYMEMIPLRKSLRHRPMVVVSFNGDAKGWYIDATRKNDSRFTTFFFDELIPFIDRRYRTRSDPASRGVTGFSMGGYGAFHFMLTHPDRIGSASALSGAFTLAVPDDAEWMETLTPLLGDYKNNRPDYDRNELYPRLETLIENRVRIPPMFLHCGTEDPIITHGREMLAFLLQQNKKLQAAKKTPLDFQYRESAGAHNWPFWRDASVGIADFHWACFENAAKAAAALTQ